MDKLSFLDSLSLVTQTDNGAVTNSGSGSSLVDLFNQGATTPSDEQLVMISLAWQENPLLATKIVMYLRNVRGGQGNRDILQNYFKFLAVIDAPKAVLKILVKNVPEIGSWKDLMKQLRTTSSTELEAVILKRIKKALEKEDALCAKWLPRETNSIKNKHVICTHLGVDTEETSIEDLCKAASIDYDKDTKASVILKQVAKKLGVVGVTHPNSTLARSIAEYLGLTPSEYRKRLSSLTNVVEQKMASKQWHTINYSHVPSRANMVYMGAFLRNDGLRREEFLDKATKGEVKMNSGALYLHEMVSRARVGSTTADALYASYHKVANEKNVLVLTDTSASMYTLIPNSSTSCIMDISIGLSIYFAECNTGEYKDFAMVFAGNPKPHRYPNGTLTEKIQSLPSIHDRTTNINGVFSYILEAARKAPQDTPATILIVSDMQFNCVKQTDKSNFQHWKDEFDKVGVELPQIIFWNVDAGNNNTPVTVNDDGVVLVGGYSQTILNSILSLDVKDFNPYDAMAKVITPLYPWVDTMFSKVVVHEKITKDV